MPDIHLQPDQAGRLSHRLTVASRTVSAAVLPLQILCLNLVTDVFPAFALAMSGGEREILKSPPRNPWLWGSLLLCSMLLAAPPYLAPIAHVLALTSPTPIMLAIIFGLSLAPLFMMQVVMLILPSQQSRY